MMTLMYQLFGGSFWLLVCAMCLVFARIFFPQQITYSLIVGICLISLGYSLLMHGGAYDQAVLYSGGLLGEALYFLITAYAPESFIFFVSWLCITTGILLMTGYSWVSLFFGARAIRSAITLERTPMHELPQEVNDVVDELVIKTKPQKKVVEHEIPYPFPALAHTQHDNHSFEKNNLSAQHKAHILQEKLLRFGIKGKVMSITAGPVVTLYEYQPDIDAKISKILAREDDLALALQALSLRIIAPIAGKAVVGFEVAQSERMAVYFSALYEQGLKKFKGYLPLVLGQNTIGAPVVIDLAHMPHLLVAGATGSGKSVALNTMLISLICFSRPEDLKLILIDPKKLEFSTYDGLPHLLFPIVTEPERALAVLRWAVKIMQERYERMAQAGVRHAKDYHALYHDMAPIVIVIDEFADLMITTGKEIEELIVRLAQMARAAGIHIILATQRPSVDVITGLIKVNFPARIAFKVTSKIDSRTIIDTIGADKLLGKGDMLFLDNQGSLTRIHGAYMSDAEIADVVKQIKAYGDPIYEILSEADTTQAADIDEADQKIFEEIVRYVRQCDEISISLLQRKFRIGYNRSARMIDTLESRGIILPSDGGKMRKVLH